MVGGGTESSKESMTLDLWGRVWDRGSAAEDGGMASDGCSNQGMAVGAF